MPELSVKQIGGAELTVKTGKLNECVFCTLKHLTDAVEHAPQELRQELEQLRNKLLQALGIADDYLELREKEHILEDYIEAFMTKKVQLRLKRKELEGEGCLQQCPVCLAPAVLSLALVKQKCPAGMETTDNFCVETIMPKEYFDERSFRAIKHSSGHVIVIGCPKGNWDEKKKRCLVGTQAHHIKHPISEVQAEWRKHAEKKHEVLLND